MKTKIIQKESLKKVDKQYPWIGVGKESGNVVLFFNQGSFGVCSGSGVYLMIKNRSGLLKYTYDEIFKSFDEGDFHPFTGEIILENPNIDDEKYPFMIKNSCGFKYVINRQQAIDLSTGKIENNDYLFMGYYYNAQFKITVNEGNIVDIKQQSKFDQMIYEGCKLKIYDTEKTIEKWKDCYFLFNGTVPLHMKDGMDFFIKEQCTIKEFIEQYYYKPDWNKIEILN
jgi:hypothetical protein